jgi:hypothetical protein
VRIQIAVAFILLLRLAYAPQTAVEGVLPFNRLVREAPLLYASRSLGSVADLRREPCFRTCSGKGPSDLTRRLSFTTRSCSSRGLLIRYM